MGILILYGLLGTGYFLYRTKVFAMMIESTNWPKEVPEKILRDYTVTEISMIIYIWPLGLGVDAYHRLVLDEDDFTKEGKRKKKSKKR
jgi:hypothetical protein